MAYQNFMDLAFKNSIMDTEIVDGDLLALTTDLPDDDTAGTEVVGGVYARQAVTWLAASGGWKEASAVINYDDLPLCDVWGWELWSADGLTRKWVGPWAPLQGVAADAGADQFTYTLHGLVDGDQVHFLPGSLTGGFAVATKYYVINSAANTFQLSATSGGVAVDVTDATPANLGRIYPMLAGADFSVSDFILKL